MIRGANSPEMEKVGLLETYNLHKHQTSNDFKRPSNCSLMTFIEFFRKTENMHP